MNCRLKRKMLLILFAVSVLVLSSCSRLIDALYSDVVGSDAAMRKNEKITVYSEPSIQEELIYNIEEAEAVGEQDRYIYSLDGMRDYEMIEYVMPAIELAEEFSGTYSACSEWYGDSYYALWEEANMGDYDNVAALTNYSMEWHERTYGKDIYSIYGDYLGDRDLITNGHRMCKSSEFSNYEEVESYLLNYFSSNFTAKKMDDIVENLWEYDGELYHIFIDGYAGWMSHASDTATVLSTRSDACKISVICYTTRDEERQGVFEFVIEDEKIVLDSIEYVS